MRRAALALTCFTLLMVAMIWAANHSQIDPIAYEPAEALPLIGPLTNNDGLQAVELLAAGRLPGPEDIEIDLQGRVLTGLADGTIRRLGGRAGDAEAELVADTGGRPLGLDLDRTGILWVADTRKGLLTVDSGGQVESRSVEAEGVAIGFADDVDVAADGRVFFSDASTRFGPDRIHLDALEARPHGRLLVYHPASGRTEQILDGLYFANGVAVSKDSRFVLVAETFRYRIRRLWLRGVETGNSEILVDNLPGFPDGVSSTDRGTFWVAIHSPRSSILDRAVHPRPWLKRTLAALPRFVMEAKRRYGLVLEIDEQGRILRSLHDPTGRRFAAVTSIEELDGYLYLGTVDGEAIGRVRLP